MGKDRTARAGVLVSLLVAFGGTAAMAQSGTPSEAEDEAQQAVSVAGTSTLVGQGAPGTTEMDGAVIRVRGNELLTLEQTTDPRTSGRALITVNYDAYPDPSGLPGATQVRYGQMRLENDEGAWSGYFTGSLSGAGFLQTYWLEGEGAYEGLSYVVTAGGNGNVWQSSGLIFPGDVPTVGAGNSLPIDAIGDERPAAWIAPA